MSRRTSRRPGELRPISCLICGAVAQVRRADARTCSPKCKKRLQRQHRKEAGQGSTARDLAPEEERFRLSPPGVAVEDLRRKYPQGCRVLFNLKDGGKLLPGRVEWNSKAGAACLKGGGAVPVADLMGVHKVAVVWVHRY